MNFSHLITWERARAVFLFLQRFAASRKLREIATATLFAGTSTGRRALVVSSVTRAATATGITFQLSRTARTSATTIRVSFYTRRKSAERALYNHCTCVHGKYEAIWGHMCVVNRARNNY